MCAHANPVHTRTRTGRKSFGENVPIWFRCEYISVYPRILINSSNLFIYLLRFVSAFIHAHTLYMYVAWSFTLHCCSLPHHNHGTLHFILTHTHTVIVVYTCGILRAGRHREDDQLFCSSNEERLCKLPNINRLMELKISLVFIFAWIHGKIITI